MFTLQNKIGLKHLMKSIILNRYRYISSAALSEARDKFKVIGGGCVHLEKDEESGIAIVTLDNPSKKNAISGLMMTQLEEIVSTLETWETGKAVILTSHGDTFCAGSDLSSLQQIQKSDVVLLLEFMNNILNRLFVLPLITVTLVHNKALGGGAELTTATDFRVFGSTGEVIFLEGKMGLSTGWGGGTRLVKILGPRITLDLLCSGRRLKAKEALLTGFADHIVTGQDKLLETKEWLHSRTIYHPSIIQAMKKVTMGARDLNLNDSFKYETEIFSQFWGGPLNLEAIKKFMG